MSTYKKVKVYMLNGYYCRLIEIVNKRAYLVVMGLGEIVVADTYELEGNRVTHY
jgi:hypothetical protein